MQKKGKEITAFFAALVMGVVFSAGVTQAQIPDSQVHALAGVEGDPFVLLSQYQEGISYYRDPCNGSSFSLIFSFSADLQEPPRKQLAFVDFSAEFKDIVRSMDIDTKHVGLLYSQPKKIGNRQYQVDYVARKVSYNGTDKYLVLPDQVEVILIDDDFRQVYDIYDRQCSAVSGSGRNVTLINKNSQLKCYE